MGLKWGLIGLFEKMTGEVWRGTWADVPEETAEAGARSLAESCEGGVGAGSGADIGTGGRVAGVGNGVEGKDGL